MWKIIHTEVNGKKVQAYLIDNIKRRKRVYKGKRKESVYEERYIWIYIPKNIKTNKFLLVPWGDENE